MSKEIYEQAHKLLEDRMLGIREQFHDTLVEWFDIRSHVAYEKAKEADGARRTQTTTTGTNVWAVGLPLGQPYSVYSTDSYESYCRGVDKDFTNRLGELAKAFSNMRWAKGVCHSEGLS